MVVWCLYDDCGGSWNKLKLKNVYSLGINDNNWDNYFKIDLSLQNQNLKKDLKKIEKITGKPDVIIAHPPCECWSKADAPRRLFRTFYKNGDDYGVFEVFNKNFYFKNNYLANIKGNHLHIRNFHTRFGSFLNGLGTIGCVDYIIELYKPKIWIVENPLSSKVFNIFENYFLRNFYSNKFYYNNWDSSFSPKPTFFISNIEIPYESKYEPNDIIICYKRANKKLIYEYEQSSNVPKQLLLFIYDFIKNKLEVQHEW